MKTPSYRSNEEKILYVLMTKHVVSCFSSHPIDLGIEDIRDVNVPTLYNDPVN